MFKKELITVFALAVSFSMFAHPSFSGSTDIWKECKSIGCDKISLGGIDYWCIYDNGWSWSSSTNKFNKCDSTGKSYIRDYCSGANMISDDDNICGNPSWSGGGCTGIAECALKTVGTNINYCNKGGQTYFADNCSSTCQGQDRDNICRNSTFASGCTADSQCNGVVAGIGSCDSTCKYTPGCSCSSIGCGLSPCSSNQMKRSCTPVGCSAECVGPSYGSWINQGCGISCGGSTCLATQQCQKRTDSYGCAADQYQCVADATCGTCTYSLSINPSSGSYTDTTNTWSIDATDSSTSQCSSPINYTVSSSTSGTCDAANTYVSPNSFTVSRGATKTSAFSAKVTRTTSNCILTATVKDPNGNTVATGTSYTVSSTTPPTSATTVTIDPSYVASGQEVNLTIVFTYTNYNQGGDANVSLYIIPQDCTEQSCYIRWDSSNGCGIGWKKWKTGLSWGGSSPWQSTDGKTKITSQNGRATIETKCTIPSGISSGTHKVRAIPTIYSIPITLRAAEASFIVLNDFETSLQKLFNNVLAVFQKIFLA